MARFRQLCILVVATGLVLVAGAQPPPGEDESSPELERKRFDALRQENRYLQQRLREMEDDVDSESRADTGLQGRLDQALEENRSLRATLERQRADLAALESVRSELRAAKSTTRQLEERLEQARVWHQQQTEAFNNLRPAMEELNRSADELAARDRQIRQLELALMGADQEANTIDQLRGTKQALETRIRLAEEDRDAVRNKIRDAADELTRMRAETAATAAARDEAEAMVQAQIQRALEQEAALAASRDTAARQVAELSLGRDELLELVAAARTEQDGLIRQLAELAEFRDDLEASNRARITAERRAAGAEAEALRAATRVDEAVARADQLARRVAELEQACEALRAQLP